MLERIKVGKMKTGKLNKITDVPGVKVGHKTVKNCSDIQTGVTVIFPHENNIYKNRLIAGYDILNGFGKSVGLIELSELGIIESPIVLTNTLNVGKMSDALIDYMIDICEKDNIDLKTFNPIVCECNDSYLNNIKKRAVNSMDLLEAIKNVNDDFELGDVGAGRGMSCHKLSGGIGSSSREFKIGEDTYTLGVLVLSNYGLLEDLQFLGKNIGVEIKKEINQKDEIEKGSIISIIATDVPLSSRQLNRVCKRVTIGLARVGSHIGNGSGDISIGFSTANIISRDEENINKINELKFINESNMDILFRAVIECEEEAILTSLLNASEIIGYNGNIRYALKDYMYKYLDK